MRRAFRAASPEVQRAVLEFHAPVDGPLASEMRRLLTGPKEAVEKAIKVRGSWGYAVGILAAAAGILGACEVVA